MQVSKYINRSALLGLSLWSLGLLSLFLGACRKDEEPQRASLRPVLRPSASLGKWRGLYLLNEGTMGHNLATLDYLDYATGIYQRNIFAERNPSVARELGDVGNDLKLYRGELWAVINKSNLVEVMDAQTAKHLAQISIPNCRYISFDGAYAYVSSYAGPVRLDPNAREGEVLKIDIATKRIVARCTVGYQPEELLVVGKKLYVANSGGYRVPHYDDRLTLIDLESFTVQRHIRVGINLHRLLLDGQGTLWISSRGDHKTMPSRLYALDTKSDELLSPEGGYDVPCAAMALWKDRLYLYGSGDAQGNTLQYSMIDTGTKRRISSNFLGANASKIRKPYGIAINEERGELLITDAGNYSSPGQLLCFSLSGELLWQTETGVIPSCIVLSPYTLRAKETDSASDSYYPRGANPYASRLLAYSPAPGQFVNRLPEYQDGDGVEQMRLKAEQMVTRQRKTDQAGMITLGAWGGYVVVGFDHRIENKAGLCDFRVLGNAFEGGSEPGVIYVARDNNGNGYPDEDEWYRIAGSAELDSPEPFYALIEAQGLSTLVDYDYMVSYSRPERELQAEQEPLDYIAWQDNKGGRGFLRKNSHHRHAYYPMWLYGQKSLSFSGLRLPSNVSRGGESPIYTLHSYRYGYADNYSNRHQGSAIDIDWAVDVRGQAAQLDGIDFVKVQSAVLSDNGDLGESSTEFSGVEDLHLKGERIPSPTN